MPLKSLFLTPSFLRHLKFAVTFQREDHHDWLKYSAVIVFTFTTHTILTDDGYTSMIRARSYFPRGNFSSFKSNTVPGSIFV